MSIQKKSDEKSKVSQILEAKGKGDFPLWMTIAAFGMITFLAGAIVFGCLSYSKGVDDTHKEAAECGAGYYHPKSGAFHFVDVERLENSSQIIMEDAKWKERNGAKND